MPLNPAWIAQQESRITTDLRTIVDEIKPIVLKGWIPALDKAREASKTSELHEALIDFARGLDDLLADTIGAAENDLESRREQLRWAEDEEAA